MLKRVQHDKQEYVIPNLFRNLEFGNANESIAFVLIKNPPRLPLPAGRQALAKGEWGDSISQ
jgi:hypothetical protein